MDVQRCSGREEFEKMLGEPEFAVRWKLERFLAERHQGDRRFELPGFCAACREAVPFEVDFAGAWVGPDGVRIPHWRESTRCPSCRLNGRQRMTARLLGDAVADRGGTRRLRAYAMEQASPLFRWATTAWPGVDWVGSEYLGRDLAAGTTVNDLRHEDGEALSFESEGFDIVVSCDVLEHVNRPACVLAELRRVLRRNGLAILTVPIEPQREASIRRAEARPDGAIEHLVPPVFHGNPLSPEGSLVFTDFGWDLLDQMHAAGFRDVRASLYWGYEQGYLGIQFYLLATKP